MAQYAYDFLMPQPQSYNYLDSLTQISGPNAPPLSVPNSPMSANGTMPVAPSSGGFLNGLGKIGGWLGENGQTIGNWANIIGQGLNAYIGLQQLGMAKDALKFEKKSFKTNLANSVQAYNTQIADRIAGRYYATEEERQAALKAAELPQGMRG